MATAMQMANYNISSSVYLGHKILQWNMECITSGLLINTTNLKISLYKKKAKQFLSAKGNTVKYFGVVI